MGAIPTTPTFVAGEKLTAAKLNQVCSAVDFWASPPRCYAYQAGAQTLTTGVSTAIALDGEVYDIVQAGDSLSHDLVTNNSRLVVRTSGKYLISGQVMFSPNATGSRVVQIRSNAAGNPASGTQLAQSSQGAIAGGATSTSVPAPTIEVALSAGDYIEMFASQSSGGNLALNTGQANTFLYFRLSGS